MYKVTLSMPIYNVAPYVERALLSALNQTFESIEYLLVDDRGSDNSMEIVRRIVQTHPRGKDVRIIEHPYNIGTGATKNTAIDNAQGEYLFFMDSDDEITPDCIQILYDKMIESPVDLVVGSMIEISVDGSPIFRRLKDQTIVGELSLAKYVYEDKEYFPIMTWNKLYNLSFIRNNNLRCYPKHLNEDEVFSLKVVHSAKSVSFVSAMTIRYYRRENSTTGNRLMTKGKMEQYLDILTEYRHVIESCPNKKIKNITIISMLRCSIPYVIFVLDSLNLKISEKKLFHKNVVELLKDFSLFNLSIQMKDKSLLFYTYYKLPFLLKLGINKISKYAWNKVYK